MGYSGDKNLWSMHKKAIKQSKRELEKITTTCIKCKKKDTEGLIDGLCYRCF